MKSTQAISAHRHRDWQGQYNRMMRWVERFKEISFQENKSNGKTHLYFDTMYACFQNIFFLKDWLVENSTLTATDLNTFINSNKEIGVCRDICNGTKHYNISNASVDKEFGIIRQYVPFHKVWNISEWEIVICAGGDTYKPYDLISKSVELWDDFISGKLNLERKISTT